MKIIICKKIGKSTLTFEVEGENPRAALAEAAFYTTTPDICGICSSENVVLDHNLTEDGYEYIKIRCLEKNCQATSTLGSYKKGGNFWKKFEQYKQETKIC